MNNKSNIDYNDSCVCGCCSECDFDSFSERTNTTLDSFEECEECEECGQLIPEVENTRDATAAGEICKIYLKKENCGHYISGCKIISKCCNKEFGCRICHDLAIEDHKIDRYEIEEIICNTCKTKQPISNTCTNVECSQYGEKFSSYYCNICHLYSDNPVSEIYHCDKCNICRMCSIGTKPSDFFHCDKCGGCVSKLIEKTHKCVTDSLRNDCCICLEGIFQSRESVSILPCGHAIHSKCFDLSIQQNKFSCPLCRKIMINGNELDKMIQCYDNIIALNPYENSIVAKISCNDCDFKGEVTFHPVGLKCGGCGGYNTVKTG